MVKINGRIDPQINLLTKQQWRSLLRALLRETSYLPDPIARHYLHEQTIKRWRTGIRQKNLPIPTLNLKRKEIKRNISLLQRANQGYMRPLEKVLFLAYGRTGRRRHDMLAEMTQSPIPANTEDVRRLVKQKQFSPFDDGSEPPAIMMSLLKSQINNGIVQQSRVRGHPKLDPAIPEKDSWDRPLANARRQKLRARWFSHVMDCLLPPLPEHEQRTLEGLIAGSVPWAPVKRRTPGRSKQEPTEDSKSQDRSRGHLHVESKTQSGPTITDEQTPLSSLQQVLNKGPWKSGTFDEYANGRPHHITRRFMRHMWRRVAALVPRCAWDVAANKWRFSWTTPKEIPQLVSELKEDIDPGTFFDRSPQEKLRSQQSSQTASSKSPPELLKPRNY